MGVWLFLFTSPTNINNSTSDNSGMTGAIFSGFHVKINENSDGSLIRFAGLSKTFCDSVMSYFLFSAL